MSLLKKSILLFIINLSLGIASAQTVTYTGHDEVIANPERGFYRHTEVHTANYSKLSATTLRQYRENQSITQILRVFYLEAFRKQPISSTYLDNMRKDFAAAREAGLKVIVRFAYARSMNAPYNDATPEMVLSHIEQLKPVLRENADVVAVVQAGFVGAWGEWYYTDHFAGASPGNVTEEDWAERQKVVEGLLDALPTDRMVQIRTPGYKMIIFDRDEPLSTEEAFSGTDYARVGHHNDCFVASSSDFGTYVNPDKEKPYLEQETRFLPMGGETCALAPPYSDCDFATGELERFHWSYLNINYNQQVLDEWENQGCFDEVELRLGYRLRLLSTTVTTETQPGGTIHLNVEIINDGYSSPYNPRLFEVVLKDKITGEEYFLKTEEDPRRWPVKEEFEVNLAAGLPDEMPEGDYQLFLNLPDPYPLLYGNPDYSIRFANENVWNETLGYNDLQVEVSVSNENESEAYSGETLFSPRSAKNTLEVEGSEKLFAGADGSSILLFWGRQSGYQRIIERSIEEGPFEKIAATNGSLDFYKDTDVEEGVNYSYRYYLIQGAGESSFSDTVSLTLNSAGLPQIAIDAQDEDWKAVPPVSSATAVESYSLRGYFDEQNANFIVYGPVSKYELYLDTDNNPETGAAASPVGMDYLIRDDSLFTFSENEWSFTGEIAENASADNLHELSISHSLFENIGFNPNVPIYGVINDQVVLADSEGSAAAIVRIPPPDIPESLMVINPDEHNESRLVLEWELCHYCQGYRIERSEDGTNFQQIREVESTVSTLNDDGLTNDQTYYYRLYSYNELGVSTYTDIVDGTVGQRSSPLSVDELAAFSIYPNPSDNYITISFKAARIEVYNLQGKMVLTGAGTNKLDISALKKGIYLLRGYTDEGIKTLKLIKK